MQHHTINMYNLLMMSEDKVYCFSWLGWLCKGIDLRRNNKITKLYTNNLWKFYEQK